MTSFDENVYERLKKSGAFLPPGASGTFVEIISDDLDAQAHARLPADYADFLSRADGTQSAAFLLYGTAPQALAGGQIEPDIFEATMKAKERLDIGADIVLGRASGNLLVMYSADGRKYAVRDAASGDVLDEFPNLAAFMTAWMDRKKL